MRQSSLFTAQSSRKELERIILDDIKKFAKNLNCISFDKYKEKIKKRKKAMRTKLKKLNVNKDIPEKMK